MSVASHSAPLGHSRRLTWDDIADWPVDGRRTELFHGELVLSPTAGSRHGILNTRLAYLLTNYILPRDLGDLFVAGHNVVLAPDVVYIPDLCFVSKQRASIVRDSHIAGPPDLVVEIVSESNRRHDWVTKRRDYGAFGVDEYWLVDIRDNALTVLVAENGVFQQACYAGPGDPADSRIFPDLNLDTAALLG